MYGGTHFIFNNLFQRPIGNFRRGAPRSPPFQGGVPKCPPFHGSASYCPPKKGTIPFWGEMFPLVFPCILPKKGCEEHFGRCFPILGAQEMRGVHPLLLS
jgi:hypothetical protein